MRSLSSTARAYIFGTIFVGLGANVWQFLHLGVELSWLLAAVSGLAVLAQVLKVEGPTNRSNYSISLVTYSFALIALGPTAAIVVVWAGSIAEWIWHRYPWYIQAFNIASWSLSIAGAGAAYGMVTGGQPPLSWNGALGIVAAVATYVSLNHLMVGIVLRLARGESFSESGVFDRLTLIIDATLLGMGAGAALIWQVNPYASVFAVVPLYLVYSTLQIPSLQRKAETDPKTGLFNARHFTQSLEKELARADRFDRPLVVVMADLDLLRNINNTYGHLAGDQALVTVANILKKKVRDYDIVARFGGEEFAILLPETTLEQAAPRIGEIRAAIEAAEIEISTSVTPLRVTMSFGIATRDRFGLTQNQIVHSADLAVYQAKLAGRNRICAYVSDGVADVTTIAPQARAAESGAEAPGPTPPPAAGPSPKPAAAKMTVPEPQLKRPHIRPRPAWAVHAYIAIVASVASGGWLWVMVTRPTTAPDWFGLGLFAALAVLTEWLSIDIYVRDTSVSTSIAPLAAGTIVYGPIGAILISAAMSAATVVKHHHPISRFVFNASNHLIVALLCLGAARGAGQVFGDGNMPAMAAATILATWVSYLSSTWLVAGAIDLNSGQPFYRAWSERFRWLWPYYLGLGVVAYALVFSFQNGGLIGMALTLVPLLVLRLGQAQYLEHSKSLVNQLRGTNSELQQKSDEISALNEELLLALSRAIDLRDPDVQDHSQQVSRYAALIAVEMNLPPERVELVRKAGLLHDIGKLGIPEAILFKPERLTEEEYEDIKQHSAMGAEIVGYCHSLRHLVPFIRHHHERYDGRGYPDGLQGHEIPLEARILSVADTIEAMAADRPYRRGRSADLILSEIQANADTQFDPLVVAALSAVMRERGQALIVNSARELHPLTPAREAPSLPVGDDTASQTFNSMIGRLHHREARRYRAIVEDQAELICRFLPDGTLTFVNEAYCRYFDRTSAELVGRSFMPMLPEEDRRIVETEVVCLSREKPMTTYAHRVILPDGSIRWQEWTDRAIFNPQDEIVEYQSVGRDITEQKIAEAALQDAYHKLERRNQQLAQILETGNSLRLNLNLDSVLEQIVDGIHRALGFEVVVINLVDQSGQRVRLAAHTGLSDAEQKTFAGGAVYVSWEQSARKLLQERFRVGQCYFIPGGALDWARDFSKYLPGADGGAGCEGRWDPDDALVLPITLRSGQMAGLISVDQPADGFRPTAEVLQGLEIFANQAVAAIENAWTYEQLQQELQDSQRIEAARHADEQRLELALEAANAGVWEWDIRTGQAIWSDANYRLMGLEPGSCPAAFEHWLERVHPGDRERAQTEVAHAVAGRLPLDVEYRVEWPNGQVHWVRDVGKVQLGADGRSVRMVGIKLDITKLQQTEAALQESENRYRLLAENVTDVVWVRDLNLHLTYVSPSVQRLRGYTPEEAMTQDLEEALTPESAALARQFFAEMQKAAQYASLDEIRFRPWSLTLQVRRKDGAAVWTESRMSFLLDEHNRPTSILGITGDMRERR